MKQEGLTMKSEISALNLVTLDFIYSGIHRLPGLGEEVATGHLTLSLGGGPIASLITASRLGAKVRLATCLGQDRFSMIARDFLEQESIPYRSFPASLAEGQSPVNVTSVMSIPGVDRSFVSYFPTTDFYSAPSPELVRYIGDSAYCIASSPNAALFHALQESGCRVIYDVGWSDDLCIERLKDVLSAVYLFAPNEKEALKLTGAEDVRSALLEMAAYVRHPIVKLGKRGALFLQGDEIVHAEPVAFDTVDSTGAGDAFLGGVTFGLLQGWDLRRCVELGNYTGGKATTGIGCLTSKASIAEFEELCRKSK